MSFASLATRSRSGASALIAWGVLAWEALAQPPGGDAVGLQLGRGAVTQRWRVQASIEGCPSNERWSAVLAALRAFHDLDNSGDLDEGEASHLPSTFGLRQMVWGQFLPSVRRGPEWETLDADHDGRASDAEVAACYRQAGLTGVVFSFGQAPHTAALSEAVWQAVAKSVGDSNASANSIDVERLMRRLDADGNEALSPAEFVPGVTYPGTAANELLGKEAVAHEQPAATDALSINWFTDPVTGDTGNRGVIEEGAGEKASEASSSKVAPVEGAIVVRFGATESTGESAVLELHTTSSDVVPAGKLASGQLCIQVRADIGTSLVAWKAARRRFESQFAEASQGDREFADSESLYSDRRMPEVGRILALADRNHDQRLTQDEFDGWLSVQEELVAAQILVSVVDFGAGAFEFLDESRDGLLSKNELARSASRLKDAGCLSPAGELQRERLPHHVLIVVSRGTPQTLLTHDAAIGPAWFQALDRNGDGVVSAAEYGGDLNSFEQLDQDGDGLICPAEANGVDADKGASAGQQLGHALADLGRSLFFDRSLSGDGTLSCADCHRPDHGWSSPDKLPRGVAGRLGSRHAPTLYNAGLRAAFFWDGRANSLEEQVLQPIANPLEMDQPIEPLLLRLSASATHRELFVAAGCEPSAESLAAALAAYCRTIVAEDAPFDRFRAGDMTALSPAARRGHDLFHFRLNCSVCHSGPQFTDGKFHNLGIGMDRSEPDLGRFVVKGEPDDRGAFKTPSLRNIAKTAPYMHDGRFDTLAEVVDFYVDGGLANPQLDQLMNVFPLNEKERADLVAFLSEGLTSKRDPAAEAAPAPR